MRTLKTAATLVFWSRSYEQYLIEIEENRRQRKEFKRLEQREEANAEREALELKKTRRDIHKYSKDILAERSMLNRGMTPNEKRLFLTLASKYELGAYNLG
ncbi:hypothetical protein ACFSVM_09900 [Paenibacillus shunpengii]|uniref:Uncharacterized protein n=1 Tax=Paenibacillus shunpengii TaxID=2054424 RepID=A0ABW5SLZ5_9BACL